MLESSHWMADSRENFLTLRLSSFFPCDPGAQPADTEGGNFLLISISYLWVTVEIVW